MKYTKFFYFLLVIFLSPSCACLLKKPYCIKNYAKLETNKGTVVVGLYEGTPKHKENFIQLCRSKAYDSVLVYKILPSSTISIGLTEEENEKDVLEENFPEKTISQEFHKELIHKKNAVAMHRLDDNNINPEKKSDGRLFYIVEGAILSDRIIEGIIMNKNLQIYNKYVEKFLKYEENSHYRDSLNKYSDEGLHDEWRQLRGRLYQYAKEMAIEDNAELFEVRAENRQIYSEVGGIPVFDNVNTVFGEVTFGFKTVDKISKSRVDIDNKPIEDIFILSTDILNRREYRRFLRKYK